MKNIVSIVQKGKQAADAERDSIKYKRVEFMGKHLGERFKAILVG